ncbi:Probable RNA-directed DNA polymerase from transposon BS [Eumeta japonica]|uniref:Probable RNA-directed DNA polymerase from transposon BS n=1 Tax=Eumeta variegata TaxID=151549 RepID=A0A4C1SSC9_EUMVA|nr:Probable RNA-directed DNA polymerase from transposon BS [Eumeta japonica]
MTGHGILILVSVYLPPKEELHRSNSEALFALGDAVILFRNFNSKSTNWNCNYSNRNGREMEIFTGNLHFNIVTPLTPTHYPSNDSHRPDILDIALMKGVALKLPEPLQCLNSDHRPVFMRLGSLIGDYPAPIKTITNWQKTSAAFEEINTPISNSIPNDIISTDEIDNAIGALSNHIRTVVENSSRTVPAKSDRKKLPRDVNELVKARMKEVRNENWSNLMTEISPSLKAYWGLAKALKTEVAVPTLTLKRQDKCIVFNDQKKAECSADSIEKQCSENLPYDFEHVSRVEKEVRHRISLPPKDVLGPITHDEVSKQIKGRKIRKAPARDTISSKALKCFSAPLVTLLVEAFNVYIQHYYFPTAWKEAVVIDIPKPGKPSDLPASYRPISLLSVLEYISEEIKLKRKTMVVLFNAAKAFDRVCNRHFFFRLDNTYSSMRPIRAGVPQDTTLSSLLYSTYVNDIPCPSTGVQLAFFADDTALYLTPNSIENILPILQRTIDELTQWFRLWTIDVNPDKPVMTYASPVFAHAKPEALYSLQIVENKFCRRAASAPWYVKTSVLHRDLELLTISKFMKDASERFFDIASSHPNPLLVSTVSYKPPPPHHFCRRPRNVLLDPPDDLTVEVEKLLELNKTAID